MKAAGEGRIVVVASRAGLGVGFTGIQAYGPPRRRSSVTSANGRPAPAGQRATIDRIAMRRLGEPRDIANAVLFLASNYASWITGQVLPVTSRPIA